MATGWGVIGCGVLSNVVIPNGILAATNTRLVGVYDIVAERARETAQRFETRVYSSLDELLSDPAIDAVYVVTSHSSHAEITIAAARHGKHVLCEKPLGLNAEQAEEMVLVCGENNVNLGHATMMRFNGVHRKMREMIDSGAIGRPIAIHGRYVLWSTALADPSYTDEKIWQMPASSRPLIWRQTKRLSGGGPMMDLGIHVIDTMVFLVGHIKEVASFCDTFTHNLDVEDTASVLLKFENGAQAVLECYNSVANFRGRRSLGVFGEKGSLVAEETMGPPSDKNRLLYFEAESNLSVEVGPKEVEFQPYNMYQIEFQLFSEAVEAKKPYVIPGEEGLHIQRVLDAVYRSSEERRFISIDP